MTVKYEFGMVGILYLFDTLHFYFIGCLIICIQLIPFFYILFLNICPYCLHSVLSYQLECTLEGHDDSVTCMALDANFLFSGSDDKTIRVWNLVHVTEA